MPRRREYSISLEPGGRLLVDGGAPLELTPEWSPEHLVLAALARCTLASLAYHADGANVAMSGGATASGAVARREEDGLYAFADVACRLDVQLAPLPEREELGQLLERAERGCFVGSSLAVRPRYEWRVNGELVSR